VHHPIGGHNAGCGAVCRADVARQQLRSRTVIDYLHGSKFRPTVHAEDSWRTGGRSERTDRPRPRATPLRRPSLIYKSPTGWTL
jgi:hypothetical protein